MSAAAQKDAIVFILDVKPSLWECKHIHEKDSMVTMLDKGIHAITQMIHQKIIDARKTDQIALVLFNTEGTDNALASKSKEEYRHISVAQGFNSPSLTVIKYLRNSLPLGNQNNADVMDALIVGADLLMTLTAGKKTFQKKLFLFTDPRSSPRPINLIGSDQIVAQLNDHQINLNLILLGGAEGGPSDNEKLLGEFCEQVGDAAVYGIDEALGMLQNFMTRRVRQTPSYKGNLTIHPDYLEIPVNLYSKTSIQRLPSAKKYSPYGLEGVERNLTYSEYKNEENSTASRVDLIKAYRYGRSLVPFHRLDEAQMAFKTRKSFHLLGFLPASKIGRESFMSGVYALVADPANAKAKQTISALARALYEKDYVALVRYVRAENCSPKIGILQPRIKSSYESLLFNVLPYSEDQRRYIFASFPLKLAPTAEQDEAMRAWITGMDLMNAARDEDGNEMEALRPGDTYNITFQAHYAAVQSRALHPDGPLLPPPETLLDHLSMPEALLQANANNFDLLRQIFPLRPRASNQQQEFIEQVVPQLWTSKSVDDDEPFGLPDNKKRKICPENPIADFHAMINDKHEDLVEAALMQLMEFIPKFVQNGQIDLAFECFKELRVAALREDEFELFSTFLIEYKRQAALHSRQLWSRLQEANLTLISSTENSDSPVDPIQANQFISTDLS